MTDPQVLVGHQSGDDAAVYRLNDELALVQSVDLFPPVVDDPYSFGQISAANSLSDLYAMGAKPLFALSVVGFPLAKLKLEVLSEILRGGQDKAREAGIDVVGGHSLDDAEPKYGLVVTGVVHPSRVWRNDRAQPGDVLVLTKPIGTGVLTTAIKRGLLSAQETDAVTRCMATLNRTACETLAGCSIHACTDVTGFGLLGHLSEMVTGSRVRARLVLSDVPLLPRVRELAAQNVFPGGSRRNYAHVAPLVRLGGGLSEADGVLLADAQTSGGLLVSLPEREAKAFLDALSATDYDLPAAIIGAIVDDDSEGCIEVAP